MNPELNAAFEKAAELPVEQQQIFAAFLLEELKDEAEWQAAFALSQDALSKLAKEALAEHKAGKTKPLDELFS